MKKNLMTVIILALVFANFVLTAIMMFTVVPTTQKANELITKVCEAIDLELNSGAATGLSNLPVDQIAIYSVSSGETMTINLADGDHYALVAVSLSINKESDRYKDSTTTILTEQESIIKNTINQVIRQYSKDELLKNDEKAQDEICKSLQKTYGADYIVGVNFSTLTAQ
ncbi:MAG: flagellar basal body-associated FliL family protein [Agathobacter sp.]|nr:flagellar basal body-associated FliL family protein [Agathobacter sp.]